MKCAICGLTETHPGTATVTLEREGSTVVLQQVPALVCPNCGEEYVSDSVSQRLLEIAEDVVHHGKPVDVRKYLAV